MTIGIVGYGAFGKAIASLLTFNGHTPECVDIGKFFSHHVDIVYFTVPVQHMREALTEQKSMIGNAAIVSCGKGIEQETGLLPQGIVNDFFSENPYVAISGPSFAHEIIAKIPTVVNIASENASVRQKITEQLSTPFFRLEEAKTVVELELAGAMKNIYAITFGYIAGLGETKNTQAHAYVVALREYLQLVDVLKGSKEVVQPGVIGDLVLTGTSEESRNYRYGYKLAKGENIGEETCEGVISSSAIQILAQRHFVTLPLAKATEALVSHDPNSRHLLYKSLGFNL